MKIGILTFHYAHNYGAMLQAYALRKILLTLNIDVKFVNYKLQYIANRYTIFPQYIYKNLSLECQIKFFVRTILSLHEKVIRIYRFKKFQKKFLPEYEANSLNTDCIIVGSDQVWNPSITNGYNDAYWGVLYSKIPHIAYAVSCPSIYITEKQVSKLKKIKAIGVREQITFDKLQTLGLNATLTLDPTFLLDKKMWSELCRDRPIKRKYLFSYNLSGIKDLDKLAVILEKKYFLYNSQKVSPLKKAGPNEFISWIYYSELTLISSFHGTAFSIIFHKPFIFFPNLDERDERVLSLLHQLGLEHCIYNGNLNTQNVPTINWELVDKILNLKRIESLNFLTSTLSH